MKEGYARNRALLLEELPRIGIADMHPVDGAFYVYADIARFTNDSMAFSKRLLAEAGVAATPGARFRSGRGRAPPAPLLRRIGRGLPRGGAADGGVAAAGLSASPLPACGERAAEGSKPAQQARVRGR